jgi:branched-chain amino acid transport system substrate-binding protein
MTLKGRVLQSVTVLGALLLIVAGCSRDSGGGDSQEEKKTVKIGVIAPLTGNLSELGLGIKNSVDLAVRQANEKGTVPGYEIVLAAEDDAADPATGANAANKLASDPQVAAVVGTLNQAGHGPQAGLADLHAGGHHRRLPGPVRGRLRAR